MVMGRRFHNVEVTFTEEDGGPDFRDRFVYWVDIDTGTIEYLAYYYLTNETGSRFRRLVNPRTVGGFRAVDHLNYALDPDTIGTAVDLFDELFEVNVRLCGAEIDQKRERNGRPNGETGMHMRASVKADTTVVPENRDWERPTEFGHSPRS